MYGSQTSQPRIRALIGITLAGALMRLLPHPFNVTPIAGLALFGGAHFRDTRAAFAVPLMAMLLSDLVLAFILYGASGLRAMPFVYSAFALTVVLGRVLGPHRSAVQIGGAAISAALVFYLITNFGVWLRWELYPPTLEGMLACYTAALPFLRNAALGNLLYVAIFFGGLRLVERQFPQLGEGTVGSR